MRLGRTQPIPPHIKAPPAIGTTPTSSVKTKNGLARASIKTWVELANASVKTVNGLT